MDSFFKTAIAMAIKYRHPNKGANIQGGHHKALALNNSNNSNNNSNSNVNNNTKQNKEMNNKNNKKKDIPSLKSKGGRFCFDIDCHPGASCYQLCSNDHEEEEEEEEEEQEETSIDDEGHWWGSCWG